MDMGIRIIDRPAGLAKDTSTTESGLTFFYPDEIHQDTFAPSVIITDFKKFNQEVILEKTISYLDEITLPYSDYFFSFNFVLPEYSNPLKHKFSYKLAGLDDRWILLNEGQRSATFTGIAPGKYTLIVKGANTDGVWGKETFLTIIITPPYWQTWLFRLSVSFVLVGVLLFLFRRKINQLKLEKHRQVEFSKKLIESQESERERIAGELHDSIGQELLIVRNKLILQSNDNEAEFVKDVSQMLSHSIDDLSRIAHNLRPSELDELGLTIAFEAMIDRVGEASGIYFAFQSENIDCVIKKDDQINFFRIIQEAINNIVKHSQATEATVKIFCTEKYLTVEIDDNGIGFRNGEENRKRPHFGLSSMKERAELIGGSLSIFSDERGTKLHLVVSKI